MTPKQTEAPEQTSERADTSVLKGLLKELGEVLSISKPVALFIVSVLAVAFAAGSYWASLESTDLKEDLESHNGRLSTLETKVDSLRKEISSIKIHMEAQKRLPDQMEKIEDRLGEISERLSKAEPQLDLLKPFLEKKIAFGKITSSTGSEIFTGDELDLFLKRAEEHISLGRAVRIGGGTWVAATGQCIGAPTNCSSIDIRDQSNEPARLEMVYGPKALELASHFRNQRSRERYVTSAARYAGRLCDWVEKTHVSIFSQVAITP